jgi:hypothetical protein
MQRIIDIALKTIFAAAVIFAVFSASYFSFTDDLTYRHVVSGKEFVKDLAFPKADEISYAGGVKWDKSSWLFDLFAYVAAYILKGINNLRYIKFIALIFMALFIFMTALKKQQGKYLSITMPIGLLGMLLLNYYSRISPSLVAALFTAYFIFVLEQEPSKKNALLYYTLPFATLFWANTSPTAPAAAVLTVIYTLYYTADAIEVPVKREKYDSPAILISLAGVALATLLSPAFTSVYIDPVAHFYRGLSDWKEAFSTHGLEPVHFVLLCLYLVVFVLSLAFNEKGSDVGRKSELIKDFCMSVVLILACAANMAFEPVFIAATLPMVMYYSCLIFRWSFVWPKKWTENDLAAVKIILYSIMIPALLAYGAYKFIEPKRKPYPDGAIAYIMAEKPPQNLFTTLNWASYVYYYAPAYRLMYDGMGERPDEVRREYSVILKNELDPAPILEKYGINSFLIPHGNTLGARLKAAGFKPAYFDSESVLYVNPSKTVNFLKFVDPENDVDFYEKAKFDDSVKELSDYVAKYPSAAAHLLLARLYGEHDRKKEQSYLEDTISDFPEEYPLYNLMGKTYYDDGEYSSAMDMWEQSKEKDARTDMLYNDAKKRLSREEEEK